MSERATSAGPVAANQVVPTDLASGDGRPGDDSGDDGALKQEMKVEQAVVDRAYARLEAAAESARQLAAEGHARARLGNESGLVERDAIVFQAGRRLAQLDAAREGLVFGRLDRRDGEVRYIGRLGLRDADREVLLVDWRAPAAADFYQATPEEPRGIVRRRVLQCRHERVVSVEDDLLDAENAPADLVIVGEGALLAALSRSRDATMHSVVATIQREQDAVVRSPARGVTSLHGGPGTGKTVVALHRAAYLLYTDRRRYERGGVLVVGPNPVFMSYIERVLPSLGETSVSLRALGEVVDGVRAVRHDVAEVARLKGSMRMRALLARTAAGPVPGAPDAFRVFYRDDVATLDRDALAGIRRSLLSSGQRRNRVAGRAAEEVVAALWAQLGGERALERGRAAFVRTMAGDSEFADFVADWWPTLDAVEVVGWLADRDRLARDAGALLQPSEVDALAESFTTGALSVEDIPLVDELRYLLGDPPDPAAEEDLLADLTDREVPELTRLGHRDEDADPGRQRPAGSIEDDAYAHVLVDEAQDLSPMQWRMLGRRGRRATWTVVEDPAQSSWPLAQEAATARAEALRGRDHNDFLLTTNYRNSAEIFALASAYAEAAIPGADLPVAVRSTGVPPQVEEVRPERLAERVRAAVGQMAAETSGAVGVIVPTDWAPRPLSWGLDLADGRVAVLEALDSKGLEFDGVIVVEPDVLAATAVSGPRLLYVALTRATQRLHLVGTSHHWRPR
ncbi:MAG TPA: ATP-binding domain-containing protein [Nocardioidaceae bacterium]|nr:ATP-binding domain-containing protein [Nocardioidaceae bacterium]